MTSTPQCLKINLVNPENKPSSQSLALRIIKMAQQFFPVNILENCLYPTDVVCNLGVLFHSNLVSLITSILRTNSVFANLCNLHYVRCFPSYDVSVMVTNALVSSRLDYCNSLFHYV